MPNDMIEQWDGSLYSQNSDFQYSRALKLISAHTFSGLEAVLDVGCGDGKISVELARLVPSGRVLGIDFSADMISHAKLSFDVPNLEFQQLDAEDISSVGEFDLVTSFFCLHWVPDKQKAMHNIYRSLKPKGKAILIMPVRNEVLAKARSIVFDLPEWKSVFANRKDFTAPLVDTKYLQYAERAGFKILFDDSRTEQINFPTVDGLSNFVRSITAHLGHLSSEDEKKRFVKDLMEEYLKQVPPLPDGRAYICYDFITLVVGR